MGNLDDPTAQQPGVEQQGDDTDGIQECQHDIEELEQRVAAIEAKLGIPSPQDEPDGLQQSIQNTKPFGAMSGISNS